MAVPLAPQVSPANPDRLVTGLALPAGKIGVVSRPAAAQRCGA
jgi:hypothetical protein